MTDILDVEPKYFLGPLYPYVMDDDITDVDCSGKEVWITDCRNRRQKVETPGLTDDFIEQFTRRVSNMVSKSFHKMSPVLEAETDTLRITIVHEAVCQGRRCICIRKSLPRIRLTEDNAIQSGYASREIMTLLKNCVKAGMNIVFTGNPGAGKTECARFFSNFIEKDQRVITLEDTPEWHYKDMNPDKDCIEMTVNRNMDYTQAIKTCMRLNPKWLFLAEARSTEVLSLIESFSTGVKGFTTLHTDDVRNIPDRILNMSGQKRDEKRLLNDIYTFIDVGVLLKRKEVRNSSGKTEIRRFIDQICFFSREDMENKIHMIVEDGKMLNVDLPSFVKKKYKEAGIATSWVERTIGNRADKYRFENGNHDEKYRVINGNEDATDEHISEEDNQYEDEYRSMRQKDVLEYLCNVSEQLSKEGTREKGGMTYRGQRVFI